MIDKVVVLRRLGNQTTLRSVPRCTVIIPLLMRCLTRMTSLFISPAQTLGPILEVPEKLGCCHWELAGKNACSFGELARACRCCYSLEGGITLTLGGDVVQRAYHAKYEHRLQKTKDRFYPPIHLSQQVNSWPEEGTVVKSKDETYLDTGQVDKEQDKRHHGKKR
jgi:hypothetical protein